LSRIRSAVLNGAVPVGAQDEEATAIGRATVQPDPRNERTHDFGKQLAMRMHGSLEVPLALRALPQPAQRGIGMRPLDIKIPGLRYGWRAISRYMRRSPRLAQFDAWRRRFAIGDNVMADPALTRYWRTGGVPVSAPSLTDLTNVLTSAMGPSLLRGWSAIFKFCGKSPCQLRRYRDREDLPVARWGRHVYSDRQAITSWLLQREKRRRLRTRVPRQT